MLPCFFESRALTDLESTLKDRLTQRLLLNIFGNHIQFMISWTFEDKER